MSLLTQARLVKMERRDAAARTVQKYEWELGSDGQVRGARIRPFNFENRAAALNSRISFTGGFESANPENPIQGPDSPKPFPMVYPEGARGWLARLFASQLVRRLAESAIDWHAVARCAHTVRLEMLQDLAVLHAEMDHFHRVAQDRDTEAFRSAQKNSALNAQVTALQRRLEKTEAEALSLRKENASYEKMIQVIEQLAEAELEDEVENDEASGEPYGLIDDGVEGDGEEEDMDSMSYAAEVGPTVSMPDPDFTVSS